MFAQAISALTLTPGASWQITGADDEQQRTSRELGLVAVLAVALMFLVLAGEFASFTTPLLVLTTVPLAGAGGIIALWIMGQSINAVSLIGIVVMIGMADNEAVVKLDAIRRFREQGYSIDDAVIMGGQQRLRAIAMTLLTTITGVLPLVFNWGSGGALYQPLAAGIIGGSVSALLVTFFLLPSCYARRGTARRAEGGGAGRARGDRMIRWAATRPSVVWAFAAGLLISGGVAFTKLPLATKTTVELPRLSVGARWGGASPELVEMYLTSPIEAAIQGVRGVRRTESQLHAREAPASPWSSTRTPTSRSRGSRSSSGWRRCASDLPSECPRIRCVSGNWVPEDLSEQPLILLNVVGNYTPGALQKIAEDHVVPYLGSLAGDLVGLDQRRRAQWRRDRVRRRPIAAAGHRSGAAHLGGQRRTHFAADRRDHQRAVGARASRCATSRRRSRISARLPIRGRGGIVYPLGQLAFITPEEDNEGRAFRLNGQTAVGISLQREAGADAIKTAAAARAVICLAARRRCRPGVRLTIARDESEDLAKQLNDLMLRGAIAFGAVFLVLIVTMRSLPGATLVIGSAAVAIAGTALGLYLFKIPANMLTLAGSGDGNRHPGAERAGGGGATAPRAEHGRCARRRRGRRSRRRCSARR